jgi:hypothetical protein
MPNGEDGVELVDIQRDDEEWITDHPDPKFVEGSNSDNTRGRLRHGMGITSSMMEVSGFRNEESSAHSINVRELWTVSRAIQLHAPKCRGSTIRIFMNKTTALKYARTAGDTASPLLQALAIDIQEP